MNCPLPHESKESECARVLTFTSQDVPELLITCTLTSQDVLVRALTFTSQNVLGHLHLHHKMC